MHLNDFSIDQIFAFFNNFSQKQKIPPKVGNGKYLLKTLFNLYIFEIDKFDFIAIIQVYCYHTLRLNFA